MYYFLISHFKYVLRRWIVWDTRGFSHLKHVNLVFEGIIQAKIQIKSKNTWTHIGTWKLDQILCHRNNSLLVQCLVSGVYYAPYIPGILQGHSRDSWGFPARNPESMRSFRPTQYSVLSTLQKVHTVLTTSHHTCLKDHGACLSELKSS